MLASIKNAVALLFQLETPDCFRLEHFFERLPREHLSKTFIYSELCMVGMGIGKGLVRNTFFIHPHFNHD